MSADCRDHRVRLCGVELIQRSCALLVYLHVQVHRIGTMMYLPVRAVLARDRGRVLHVILEIVGEHPLEDLIERIDDRGDRTEVRGELQWRQWQRRAWYLDSMLAHLAEQARLRIAKEIDGLHGIADEKAGAAIAGLPVIQQRAEQTEVGPRGVLKFVD